MPSGEPSETVSARTRRVLAGWMADARRRATTAGGDGAGSPGPDPGRPDPGGPSLGSTYEADIRAAYRLLLNREPDPGGLDFWRRAADRLTVADFVGAFTDAREFHLTPLFKRILASRNDVGGPSESLVEVDLPGRRLLVDPLDQTIGRSIRTNRDYEPALTAAIRSVLTPGMTFVDVGANIGWFSLLAAPIVGPTGSVFAVEAHPANAGILARSKALNGFSNLIVLPLAASDRPGTVQLQSAGGSNAAMYPMTPESSDDGDLFVTTIPLDHLRRTIGPVHVMKVDTEGAEYLALRGASETVAEHRPEIFFEFSPGMIERLPESSVAGLEGWFGDLDYHLYAIGQSASDPPVPLESFDAAEAHLERVKGGHIDIWARPHRG